MHAFNIVRFRVKPGREQGFVEAHRRLDPTFHGFVRGSLIQTGDRSYCMIGEWASFESFVAARPQMGAVLNRLRDDLEDLSWSAEPADPIAGSVVVDLKP